MSPTDLTLECAKELRRLAGTLPADGFILRDIAARIEEALEWWESPREQTKCLGALLVQAQRETSEQPHNPYFGYHIAEWLVAHGVRAPISPVPR